MQNLLVSIIIPIYKVEPYIVRCIDSVLRQTYRNLEVILVDDCTPDRSMELAKDCIEQSPLSKDLSFVYLKHEHNRGLSAARNTGMKVATGDYVYLLDSDDELMAYTIEKLVTLAAKYPGVDIVQGNMRATEERYKGLAFKKEKVPEFTDDKEWIKQNYRAYGFSGYGNIPVTAWNKLMNRRFIIDNGLWYKEGLIFEDEYWRLMNYDKINSIAFCSDETYIYHTNSTSIVRSDGNSLLKWQSILTIIRDYSMTLKKEEAEQAQYIVDCLHFRYNEYHGRLNARKLKWLYNKCLCQMIINCQMKLRYKVALVYLLLPMRYVRRRHLDFLLYHRFRH